MCRMVKYMRYLIAFLDDCERVRTVPVDEGMVALVLERLAMSGLVLVGVVVAG